MVRKVLEILQEAFQIYLKSFLVVVLEVLQDNEDHKEEVIFVTTCPLRYKRLLLVKNRKYEFQDMKVVTYVLQQVVPISQVPAHVQHAEDTAR